MTTMSTTVVALYLAVGLVSTALILDAADHYSQQRRVPHQWLYAVASGLLWPVLLVGMVQIGSVALVAGQMRRTHPDTPRELIPS